ncbi:MAG: amino acid adenylation domain-containing protein, partial [Chthonomonadales bacterium]
MHNIIVDRPVETELDISITPEIASGPYDPSIAATDFVFEPLCLWAEQTPDQIALVGGSEQITYARLDALTNQIARRLQAEGVTRGNRVAIVLPRGIDAVLSIIAVLKTGASYVPLDADTPLERIRLCLEDADPQLVITEETTGLPEALNSIHISDLLTSTNELSAEPIALGDLALSPDDIAYIIFTSGTTGRPKGVPVSHRSLTNFVRGDQETCIKVATQDRVFQGFSPASDGHHEEVWPTFLAGATLVVASADDIHSGPELADFLIEHRVSIISCAPTLLSIVEKDVPTLKRILFGAERCPSEMVRRWWRQDREIINTYGPTEATVGATFGYCYPDEEITIGKPLPNYFCYVLNDEFMPVASGAEGEFCISGVGVANGYMGSGSANSEKFISNPYFKSDLNNPILYRTGDRVCQKEDGNIVWLGRVDGQVKIRGYRIELSDIETHILKDENVGTAVVILRNAESPSPELAALLVPKRGKDIDATACYARLRSELPSYMVPHILEKLDCIPVLPSGKIDRKLCQTLTGKRLEAVRQVEAPVTETEEMLAEIWKQIFKVEEISRTDDFFLDLGGYSLLAAQFVSVLRNERGVMKASVIDVYEHPVLSDYAAVLDSRGATETVIEAAIPFEPIPDARYRIATIVQGLGLLVLFGMKAIFWLMPIITAAHFYDHGHHPLRAILYGLFAHAVLVPVSLLVTVGIKWAVIGKYKPGKYPLWGSYFLRWWFVQRAIDSSPKEFVTGTPLAGLYMRLLGAKIGKNVHFDNLDIDCTDLLTVGDNCVIENFSWMRSATVANGYLYLRPIELGEGVQLGVRAGVAGGAKIGDGASIGDLTCVREDMEIPAGEEWIGSPARKLEPRKTPAYDPTKHATAYNKFVFGAVQTILVILLPFVEMIPFAAITLIFYRLSAYALTYVAAPLFSIMMVLSSCALVLVAKWTLLGKVQPGEYPTHGHFMLRKWLVDKLLDLSKDSIMPIYDTLYTRPWCLALGMKCGVRMEIALPAKLPYDLVEFGDEGFIASDNSIGLLKRSNGTVKLARTVTGKRVFLGNNSVIPQGTVMPDDCLLGAMSVCPTAD